MKVMADAPMFRRPIRKDAYEDALYELLLTAIRINGMLYPEARRYVMKSVFEHKSTTLYIKRYFIRKDAYQNAIMKLEMLNSENKLLMDITAEEIEKYIRQNSENVSQQTIADLIIGTWLVERKILLAAAGPSPSSPPTISTSSILSTSKYFL